MLLLLLSMLFDQSESKIKIKSKSPVARFADARPLLQRGQYQNTRQNTAFKYRDSCTCAMNG